MEPYSIQNTRSSLHIIVLFLQEWILYALYIVVLMRQAKFFAAQFLFDTRECCNYMVYPNSLL